jgi:amino acid adenylation domain-containing protein
MLVKRFETQVQMMPGKVAVKSAGNHVTYDELNRRANRLAHLVREKHGPAAPVGLLFDHGVSMITAILGMLKAGLVYVPLSPAYPPNRLAYMLSHSGASLVLTDSTCREVAADLASRNRIAYLDIDEWSAAPLPEENPRRRPVDEKDAYILYTSGSTGKPRGVVQTRGNILYYIENWTRRFAITSADRLTLFSSFCHDGSVQDIFGALHNGAGLYLLYLVDQKNRRDNGLELSEFLRREGITIWHSVPSLYNYFVATLSGGEALPDLRLILLGGEALREHEILMFKKYFPQANLANVYGQTESSVNSIWLIRPEDSFEKVIIGEPLDRTRILLVDEEGNRADLFETGEILVASPHLSPGYWKEEEVTRQTFLPHPEYGRLYRTGDLGRLLPDGVIEFIGRKDNQVKIRGFRIEPGEIESRLLEHEQIDGAVVTVIEAEDGGDRFLCGYIVSPGKLAVSRIREFLARELPDYMIPAYFVQLDNFPLTGSGKVDRKALPPPEIVPSGRYLAPADRAEEMVQQVWSQVLGLEKGQIGVDANFFELGGHSLRAIMVISMIHKEFDVRIPLAAFFADPTIRGLGQVMKQMASHPFESILPVESRQYYPLSSAQKRLYILHRLVPDSTGYNIPHVLILEGTLDRQRLTETFRRMIHRHESFRTSFHMEAGEPVQRVHREVEFTIDIYSSRSTSAGEIIHRFICPFDLSTAPLLRVGLIPEADAAVLMVDMHHVITDATSMKLFVKEFMALYAGMELPEIRLGYKDFAAWQNGLRAAGEIGRQEAYWLDQFPDGQSILNLPSDYPRPPQQDFTGSSFSFHLDGRQVAAVREWARREAKATLFMVMLAVYTVLLARLSGQEDIVVGTVTAGRPHADLQSILGMFANTLAIRSFPAADKSFRQFLQEVGEKSIQAFENQDYPFEDLVEKVIQDRDMSRNPLFTAAFGFQNAGAEAPEIPEVEIAALRVRPYREYENRTTRFDLTLQGIEAGDRLIFVWQYCTGLFKEETIRRFSGYFRQVLTAVGNDPGGKLADLEILSPQEKRRLLYDFNDTGDAYPLDQTIPVLFELQATTRPDRIALVGENPQQFLTYRCLNRQTGSWARLLQARGLRPDGIAAVMAARSLEMVMGVLAVLQAGGAFLPLDPQYPMERIEWMIADSGAGMVLCDDGSRQSRRLDTSSGEPHVMLMDQITGEAAGCSTPPTRPLQPSPMSLAYVIYTSGSTGRPRGVAVAHRGIANLLVFFKKGFGITERDRVLQFANITFDASVWELFMSLLLGASLYLVGAGTIGNHLRFEEFLETHRITVATLPPPYLVHLNPQRVTGLRKLITAGSETHRDLVNRWQEKVDYINAYGPTETTICASCWQAPGQPVDDSSVPIGKPIVNTRLLILDRHRRLQPPGVPGELCIAGVGLAKGYVNQPELTAEKFVLFYQPEQDEHFMLYRSGDLARWLPDGNIEFLGRIDRQVKVRGYRIELGEVESRLLEVEGIREAVVVERKRKSGQNYLCAYVVPDQEVNPVGVKKCLAEKLPDYMIPTHIIGVDNIPLTANGKIDWPALPVTGSQIATPGSCYAAPRHDDEKRLAEAWQQVLEVERVGLDDNFFDLGATSLDVIRINNRIKAIFGQEIPVVTMFRYPTIRSLLRYLEEGDGKTAAKQEEQEKMRQPVRQPGRTGSGVAVIGLFLDFPGARTVDEFWHNLENGIEAITFFGDEELLASGVEPSVLQKPNYVRARGIIEDSDHFDAAFFDYTPPEAEVMDPQVRLFHRCVWQALEDAGYDPFSYTGRIGLYAGSSFSLAWEGAVLLSEAGRSLNNFQVSQLKNKDFMTTHISYKLNLKGPSFTLQTACSTSLVAIHLAARGVLNGECEMAVAGGVRLLYPQKRGYVYQEGMIFAPDGHCRAFDAGAAGCMAGSGAAAVVLKRLEDAIAHRDYIYAVVRGSAINNDGLRKAGYVAPSVEGQVEVIRAAHDMAGVAPGTIGYVETHGTGTALGDPVEVEALKLAFNIDKKGFCAIGSVKTNIGHLDTAAGVAGFIKAVLTLVHRSIPPSLHYCTPNPKIDFKDSPFYVNTGLREWRSGDAPRRAGVSSFGIGGTNAHLVLEEAPPQEPPAVTPMDSYHIILLSARTEAALERMTRNLAAFFRENPRLNLADAAFTLQTGRRAFEYRSMFVCATVEEAAERLLSPASREVGVVKKWAGQECRVVFMFPGQDTAGIDMGRELYRTLPGFRGQMDGCLALLDSLAGHPEDPFDRETTLLSFAFQCALAKSLMAWGVKPDALMGRGVGEYAAAQLAGIFSLEDGLRLLTSGADEVEKIPLNEPAIPCLSGVGGGWMSADEAQDTGRWREGLGELLAESPVIFIEIGSGQEMCAAVNGHPRRKSNHLTVNLVSPSQQESGGHYFFLCQQVGRLWLQGITIDWQQFYPGSERSRISLPGYDFEPQRYPVKGLPLTLDAESAMVTGPGDAQPARQPDAAHWFYVPAWVQSVLPYAGSLRSAASSQPSTWLIFADEAGLASKLAERLQEEGRQVITVRAGSGFSSLSDDAPGSAFTLHPGRSADYDALFRELRRQKKSPPGKILHLWSVTGDGQWETAPDELDRHLDRGLFSLLHIVQAMGREHTAEAIDLEVLSDGLQRVTGDEASAPHKAALLGPVKIIPLEYPNIRCRSIDVVLPPPDSPALDRLVQHLLTEFAADIREPVVAYRGDYRWLQVQQPYPIRQPQEPVGPLRRRGVYLVTGGLGGMGFTLAQYLAGSFQARLILIGRSAFPPRPTWDQWLAQPDRDKIRKVREMEALGAEVMICRADVADMQQMQEVIHQARQRFGAIHGVLHAAGVADYEGIIQRRTRQMTEGVIAPKIKGTLVLDHLLRDEKLDFLILFSSLGNILYRVKFGQVGYNAANEFLDAYAPYNTYKNGRFTVSINWTDWSEQGMTVEAFRRRLAPRGQDVEVASRLPGALSNAEGVDVFKRILASGLVNVAVCTQELEKMMERGGRLDAAKRWRPQESSRPVQPRPDLGIPYVPPRHETERMLARTWQDFLGMDRVGVHDNFFDLGATSLDILQVSRQLEQVIKRKMPLVTMFTYPTIDALARYLGQEGTTAAFSGEELQRLERKDGQQRNRLKQRKINVKR